MRDEGYEQHWHGISTYYTQAGQAVSEDLVDCDVTFGYELYNDVLYSVAWDCRGGGFCCCVPAAHTNVPPADWHVQPAQHLEDYGPCPDHNEPVNQALSKQQWKVFQALYRYYTPQEPPERDFALPHCLRCGTPLDVLCAACSADTEEG